MRALARIVAEASTPGVAVADVAWERFTPPFVAARPSALLSAVSQALGLTPGHSADC